MAPPTRCPFFWNYHARRARPLKQIAEENRGTKTKENLRAVGAFEDFLNGEESNHGGDADGVPDELTPGGFDWWAARTLAACATRPLRAGSARVAHDTGGGAFRNFSHVIFDGDAQ